MNMGGETKIIPLYGHIPLGSYSIFLTFCQPYILKNRLIIADT
jgi:hypothetical protein